MLQITIKMETVNDAFCPDQGPELRRIMEEITEFVIESDRGSMKLRDVNGNTIGTVTVSNDD